MILTLGTTDLLFALDSIPAIFGITKEPYLVLTANIFALMGLRQLYFLIGGLLQRLIYLSYGLAFLLAFIGVKLFFHALHENELPFINGGEPLDYAWLEIPIWLSLAVIVGTPDKVLSEIERQQAALGINYLLSYLMFGTMPLADAMRSLQLFSSEVMPKLEGR